MHPLETCMHEYMEYTDHAGLEISVNSRIASPFSRQIAIVNAGPSTALEPMGAKPSFRCHFLNIGPSKNSKAHIPPKNGLALGARRK